MTTHDIITSEIVQHDIVDEVVTHNVITNVIEHNMDPQQGPSGPSSESRLDDWNQDLLAIYQISSN